MFVIIFIKFLLHFSSLWVLSFVILTEKAVEYSDHVLVREIKGEDKGALELLVRRWYPRIYGYVFKLTGHEQDAYDLTQDVFIAMMQSIGSYTPWMKF